MTSIILIGMTEEEFIEKTVKSWQDEDDAAILVAINKLAKERMNDHT